MPVGRGHVKTDGWHGQRVLVTGASSGIGAATAVAFAAAGATVGICARRADRLAGVREECRARGAECHLWAVDLSRLDEIADFGRTALADLGGIDVLVNNAGVPKRRTIATMAPSDVEDVMAINYFSPVRLTLAVLPYMVAEKHGHIVNVSSMGVHSAAYRVGAYAASKAALELFTEALHLELAGSGVRTHLFIPGSTRSEFSTPRAGNDPPFPQDPASLAAPDDVANALLGCLGTDRFATFATARDEAVATRKNADVNAFVAALAARFAPSSP
jgi:short-subunit dehydrogenase